MIDLLCDTDFDLLIEDGDLSMGFADLENQQHIILANKGEYKQHPEVGAGIVNMINEDSPTAILLEIKKQLEYDGMTIENLSFTDKGTINAEGTY